ncbi:uncharacterized protein [Solanum tuberosum]|uniref:uncharacterized protein n=1 Tax=Solanum tuberosum TaxID=4113 RepID=UPI0003D28EF9|nr:PREDICTED: uncharacterized protein LOC102593460 [Solanum tuberosum]
MFVRLFGHMIEKCKFNFSTSYKFLLCFSSAQSSLIFNFWKVLLQFKFLLCSSSTQSSSHLQFSESVASISRFIVRGKMKNKGKLFWLKGTNRTISAESLMGRHLNG